MKKRFLIFLFLLLNCSLVFSQITTDRPDQTESAVVLSSGQIQVESGISIENSQSNINTLFRIGIIEGIEIRINSNYLINDKLSFMKKSSFSDFEVGAKFRIFDKNQNNTKVAFLSHLSIPSAIEVFSNNVYGLLSRLNVSHDLNNESQIGYNLGYNKFKKMDGQFIYTVVYGRSLDSFGIFFEIFGDDSKNSSNINFDSGITYLLDNKKQLDLSIGKGINNDMFFISGGISINID
ncbi:MAG: transporter [Candidatus Marisimplicoccus sp.]|jgi:hypothetical protein|tara:strand:- start:610 stop:1317 length:708 start_codon:yes stop_codon:yes gene_type:complete